MEHTPVPWEARGCGLFKDRVCIGVLDTGNDDPTQPKANAAFIVRACNNIEALVDDGQFLVDRLEEYDLGDADHIRNYLGHVLPAIERFRAALDLAKETR